MSFIGSPHMGSPHIEKAGISQPHIVTPKGIKPVLKFGYSRGKDASGNPLWRDEMAGGAALDAIGPGGAANPTVHPSLPGYSYTGASSQYLVSGAVGDFSFVQNTGIFWIESWFQLDSAGGDEFYVIAGNTAASAEKGWRVYYENRVAAGSPDVMRFASYNGAAVIVVADSAASAVAANETHKICFYGDGTNVYCILDGESSGTPAALGAPAAGNSTRVLNIGYDNRSAGAGYMDGDVYDLAIYDAPPADGVCRATFQQQRHIYGV